MSDEEKGSNTNMIIIAAASAAISGGGAHIATKDDVNSANIEDCRVFSQHAREHERANCEIEKNNILIRCK
ncbi:MAG: hypothetical protein Unbinned1520contig1002_39 [Prokaryotic dsDNA virus sp.]|nr:MAG: hypothetical protein Unbinned1520contig1002_39 [Prokaryotic dsDNA virus sp.]|tara:strand:+ start:9801 stop:10013 length:213 start_codon:yes stop_codon:yes gene_type:complete